MPKNPYNTSFLNHLNENQKKAVLATEGKVLILAGAGSGKTNVLIHRIVHLIENLNVSPQAILGLTFTNKAAGEMRDRVGKMLGKTKANEVKLSTFHSFCMKILRAEIQNLGYTNTFSLYDEKDIKRLLQQLTRESIDLEDKSVDFESIISGIYKMKSFGFKEKEISSSGSKKQNKLIKSLHERLQLSLRAYNAVDFDSLLSLTVELFKKFPHILNIYQEKYKYIMIDEFQDTNRIQYEITDLLSKKHQNLCVVGDDDQSIYGWRGAEIKNILNFEATQIIKLEQNYRSTSTILKAANALIQNNKERHDKKLWSQKSSGKLIQVFHAPTDQDEVQSVVDYLLKLKQEKSLRWKDFAILYRSNHLAKIFERTFIQTVWQNNLQKWIRGIPYQVFGGTELYERSEVKDLMSYLRVIVNPFDQEALLRIINFPRRGISDKTLDVLTQINRKQKRPLIEILKEINHGKKYDSSNISPRGIKGIQSFLVLLQNAEKRFQKGSLHQSLKWLLETIHYKKAIVDEVKSEKSQEMKWGNVQECIQMLAHYEEEKKRLEENPTLHDFITTTLLDQRQIKSNNQKEKENKVSLMTFHSSKGLEFPVCFLTCIEDHLIPHEKSFSSSAIEEERRLLYVAMTRAKSHLFISMSRNRNRKGKDTNSNPSRFLFEIPKELLEIASWKVF